MYYHEILKQKKLNNNYYNKNQLIKYNLQKIKLLN